MGKNPLTIVKHPGGGGTVYMRTSGGEIRLVMEWDPTYASHASNALQQVQEDLDQEIIRLVSPYVPYDTGTLERSAPLATDIGSGEVIHATPYATYQYYATADTRSYDPQRGAHWGERMKGDKLPQIEQFVKKRVKTRVNRS